MPLKGKSAQKEEITVTDEVLSEPIEEKSESDDNSTIEEKYDNALNDISTNNDKYVEYLNLKSRFYDLDLSNSILLYIQNKEASFLATDTYYEFMGIKLKDEAVPIIQYAQTKQEFFLRSGFVVEIEEATQEEIEAISKGVIPVETKTNTIETHLYDMSQTQANTEQQKAILSTTHHKSDIVSAHTAITDLLKLIDITVGETTDEVNGLYDTVHNVILLKRMSTYANKISILCSLYAAILLDKTSTAHPVIKAFEAASIAHIIANRFEQFTIAEDYTYIRYVIEKAKETEKVDIRLSLERINRIANYVHTTIDELLSQNTSDGTQSNSITINEMTLQRNLLAEQYLMLDTPQEEGENKYVLWIE